MCNVLTQKRQVFLIVDLSGKTPLLFASRGVLIYIFPSEQGPPTYVLLFYIGTGIMTRCLPRCHCSNHPGVSTAY